MEQACRDYRNEWTRGDALVGTHAAACAQCARWASSTESALGLLASLSRLEAPHELARRIEVELSGDRSFRLRRVLDSLVGRAAPAALDERVEEMLSGRRRPGDARRGSQKAEALRALDVQPAPDVLERLIEEELGAPERQRAERFPGSLERLKAPAALTERLAASVRRRALGRLVLGPLATLAAAGLVVWIAARGGEPESRHRFEVVQASSLEGLDPMALALAESLSGGAGGPR